MNSNLPPGVTESMIPGNRPEDEEWEAALDLIEDDARASGLTGPEAVTAMRIGLAAWNEVRKHDDARRQVEDQGVIEVFFDHEETRWIARHGVYLGRGDYPEAAILDLSKNRNVVLPQPLRKPREERDRLGPIMDQAESTLERLKKEGSVVVSAQEMKVDVFKSREEMREAMDRLFPRRYEKILRLEIDDGLHSVKSREEMTSLMDAVFPKEEPEDIIRVVFEGNPPSWVASQGNEFGFGDCPSEAVDALVDAMKMKSKSERTR